MTKNPRVMHAMVAALLSAIGNMAIPIGAEWKGSTRFRGETPSRGRRGHAAGAYGRGLRNAITKKNRAALPRVGVLRDDAGAFTLIGKERVLETIEDGVPTVTVHPRRKWLAGISAQRGY